MFIKKSTIYSSFVFFHNVLVTFMYENDVYSFLFGCLFLTSLIVHTNYNIYTNILDKMAIIAVVVYGGYVFLQRCLLNEFTNLHQYILAILIVMSFLATIFLYVYGFYYNKYCFNVSKDVANAYHSLLHLISSFGHHMIVIL